MGMIPISNGQWWYGKFFNTLNFCKDFELFLEVHKVKIYSYFLPPQSWTLISTLALLVATPLWPSVRMKLTLPKLGIWSPPGLPNV
jgi:hypothetical protein